MCTMIARQVKIQGSAKGSAGWLHVNQANVSYDHPYDFPAEHSLNIDFVDQDQDPGKRVAVELSVVSALALVQAIESVLEQARVGGYLETENTTLTSA